MSDPKDVPTPRQSSTLQRALDFAKHAQQIAKDMQTLVDKHTSVAATNIKAAVACRRLRDEASRLAFQFESWQAQPNNTTTAQRVAAIEHLADLQQRADRHKELLG